MKKKILALCLGIIAAFLSAEFVIRAFPDKFAKYLYSNGIALKADKEIGYVLSPGQKSQSASQDYVIFPFTTNSSGFRGDEWEKGRGFTIGALGDSNIMAREVADGDTAAAILGRLLNRQVLNAAIGGHGTLTEVEIYKKFLRPFKPGLVILFFTEGNDIHDNSCELTKALHFDHIQPCGYIVDGRVEMDTNYVRYPPESQFEYRNTPLRAFIRDHVLSVTVLHRVIFRIGRLIQDGNLGRNRLPLYNQVYTPPVTKAWQDAWTITEEALARLKEEVESDNGKLLVVSVPGFYKVTGGSDILRGDTSLPKEADLSYPGRRLREICARHGITFFDPLAEYQGYKRAMRLKYPYFCYWEDGHYNPMGQFMLANTVAGYLAGNGLADLSPEETGALSARVTKNLRRPPAEILGDEGLRQIYGHKVYRGTSRISDILSGKE